MVCKASAANSLQSAPDQETSIPLGIPGYLVSRLSILTPWEDWSLLSFFKNLKF